MSDEHERRIEALEGVLRAEMTSVRGRISKLEAGSIGGLQLVTTDWMDSHHKSLMELTDRVLGLEAEHPEIEKRLIERMDDQRERLDGHLRRMDGHDKRLDAQDVHIADMSGHNYRLGEFEKRLDGLSDNLNGLLGLPKDIDDLDKGMEKIEKRAGLVADALAGRIDDLKESLEVHENRLIPVCVKRLNIHGDRMGGHEKRLDVLDSFADRIDARARDLDERHGGRLDLLESRARNRGDDIEEHIDRLDALEKQALEKQAPAEDPTEPPEALENKEAKWDAAIEAMAGLTEAIYLIRDEMRAIKDLR